MHQMTGTFPTASGSRYLQQLCKHFAHKREVDFTPETGRIRFDMGTAFLTADAGRLTVRWELENCDAFAAAQHVIDSHLERFAFRENFTHMEWDRTLPPSARSLKARAAEVLRSRAPGLRDALRKAAGKDR